MICTAFMFVLFHPTIEMLYSTLLQDIRNQRRYRQRRKQELKKLKETVENLNSKEKFYEEQIDYYNQYIKVCLDNLAKK